jgi:hypothetical protein
MGAGQAVKLLQRVCCVEDDGAWGPKTQAAAANSCRLDGAEIVALEVIKKKRKFYKDLKDNKPTLERFYEGWIARSNDLEKFII